MNKENKNLKLGENSVLNIADVSSCANVENEQIALYFQFDDDEPIEGIKCNGKEFTMKMLPVENGFVEFTDGKKKFRMFVRSNENIASVTKCYLFDKTTKGYFYGLDGWENINWGNDKSLAILMTPYMAVKILTDLRIRSTDYDLWINVL